jgi:hypothetical protein
MTVLAPATGTLYIQCTQHEFLSDLEDIIAEGDIGTIPRAVVDDEIICESDKNAPPSYKTKLSPLLRIDGSAQAYERASGLDSPEPPLVVQSEEMRDRTQPTGLTTEWKQLADVMNITGRTFYETIRASNRLFVGLSAMEDKAFQNLTLAQMIRAADKMKQTLRTLAETFEYHDLDSTEKISLHSVQMRLASAVILAKLDELGTQDCLHARRILGGLATTLLAEGRYTQAALLSELELTLLMKKGCHMMSPCASDRRRYDFLVKEIANAWKNSLYEYEDPRSRSLRLFRAMHFTYQNGMVSHLAPLYTIAADQQQSLIASSKNLLRATWAMLMDGGADNRWLEISGNLAAAGLAYGGTHSKEEFAAKIIQLSVAAARMAEKLN